MANKPFNISYRINRQDGFILVNGEQIAKIEAKKIGKDWQVVFKTIQVKLEVMDARLQFVESKIEDRGFDTKPIWEKALVEIMEVNQRVTTIDRKIDVFSRDMLNLRAEQLGLEERLRKLEAEHEDGGMMTIG